MYVFKQKGVFKINYLNILIKIYTRFSSTYNGM